MVSPATLAEFTEASRMEQLSWLTGPQQIVSLDRWTGIAQHDREDQVVVVRGGTRITELNELMGDQLIPYGVAENEPDASLKHLSVGEALAWNWPHALGGPHRSWRDWVLGMSLLTASGDVVKFGSKAVKSVAGFDLHKFAVGARGCFGIPLTVTLKTLPRKALQPSPVTGAGSWSSIRRVLPADFERATERLKPAFADPAQSLLWYGGGGERFPEDWEPSDPLNPTTRKLFERMKAQFDPTNKFEPGAWK